MFVMVVAEEADEDEIQDLVEFPLKLLMGVVIAEAGDEEDDIELCERAERGVCGISFWKGEVVVFVGFITILLEPFFFRVAS